MLVPLDNDDVDEGGLGRKGKKLKIYYPYRSAAVLHVVCFEMSGEGNKTE